MIVAVIDARTGEQFYAVDGKRYPYDLAALRGVMQCTPAQMRLTLHRMGLLATVQAIAGSDPEASIVWEYATVILRNSPFIAALQGQSGLTDAQIDDLFLRAMAE